MKRTTNDTTAMSDQALVTAAGRGDEHAFDELHRRHAPLAWRLALAITGNAADATTAVAEGTGATFTAVRAGRFQAHAHPIALCTASRNAALDLRRDREGGRPAEHADDADALLAAAFASLPERWRSVLWLRDVESMDAADAAPIVELGADGVDQVAVRARRGLRERYLRAHVSANGNRDCARAIVRLGALEDGTLNESDQQNLERHLDRCADCADRHVRVSSLATGLSAIAVAPAADLHERSKAAWSAALATPSSFTGLSPRTEKVLAGVSAFAAAVGVLGAALFGTGGDDGDAVASPLAPLVSEIATPRPVDLSDLTIPVSTPVNNADSARRSMAGTWMPSSSAGGTELAAAPTGASTPTSPATGGDTGTPAAESPDTTPQIDTQVGDQPISVDLGGSPAITVGPATVDTDPDDGGDVITVEDLPEQLEPVTDTVNDVVEPVVQATEPVTSTILPAVEPVTQPITDAVNSLADGLGF